jgi:hypothetical protein
MLCSRGHRDSTRGNGRDREVTATLPVWPVSELLLAFEGEGFERGVLFAVESLEGGRVAVRLERVCARPLLDGQPRRRGVRRRAT